MLDFLNHLGTPAWHLARTMFFQTALLTAALALFDLIFGRRLRSALRYALWLLVVVKLLLPPSLLLPTGAGFWLGRWLAQPVVVQPPMPYQATVEEVEPTLAADLGPAVPATAPPPAALSLHAKLLFGWAAGALLLGLGMMLRNRPVSGLARKASEASPDLRALLHEIANSLDLRRVPALRLSDANHSPALCGFLRPVILLPRELASRLSPEGLRAVLLHELTHLRRHDLWVNLLQAVVQVLWWWNPLVWLANARIRTLREQAVDESVMLATQQDRAAYPATLVEVARHCAARPMLALSFLGIFESRRALRSRVDRLLHAPLPQRASLGWSGWVTLVAAALIALPMAFNRRVEAAPADEPAALTRPPAPSPASAPGLSPELAARYGLGRDAASTNERTSRYRMDPVLARRYGLIPAQDGNATAASTVTGTGLSPALAARYGLNQGDVSTNASTSPYRMDPVLARRYGLIPATEPADAAKKAPAVTLTVPAEDTGFDLDGQMLNANELKAALTGRLAVNTNLVLRLIARQEVPMSRVVAALDAAKAAGITRITLNTDAAAEAGQQPLTAVDAIQPIQPPPLLTRQFRVDPNTFIQGLESALRSPSGDSSAKKTGATHTNPTGHTQNLLHEFFRAAGVDFSPAPTGAGASDQARKAVYFSDRTGLLHIRATAEDLEVIEKAIQALNVAPPQVQIEAKFVEISDDDYQALGFDRLAVTPDAPNGPNFPTFTPTLTGTLTDAQFRAALKALEQRQGVNHVSAPKITTLSGRQAKISVTDVKPVFDPATGATNDIPFGPVLDVVPVVVSDQSIQLTVQANVSEFIGYDSKPPKPPRIRVSQLITGAAVWDGQTLLLSGKIQEGTLTSPTGKVVLHGISDVSTARMYEPDAKPTHKRLLVFVTPTIIDPAGQRVNDPARLPFDPGTTPPQPK